MATKADSFMGAIRSLYTKRYGLSNETPTDIGFDNNVSLAWRNAANTADVEFVKLNASNVFEMQSDVTYADGKQIKLDGSTATATAGAATLSKQSGVITTESVTTAAAASYTLTLTNTLVASTSIVLFSVWSGTNTQGIVVPGQATPGSGSVVITVRNSHASQAFNGTLKIGFVVINPV